MIVNPFWVIWIDTYHHFIGKKPVNADYSALTEKIKLSHKALKFKVVDKRYTGNWSREIFVIDSVLKMERK